MKHCTHCGNTLADEDSFCPACGTRQVADIVARETLQKAVPEAGAGLLTTLCVLTILGSVLGILRGLFYEVLAGSFIFDKDGYWHGYGFVIVSIGTLTGAILMMSRKRTGFQVYMISQVAYILLTLFILSTHITLSPGTDSKETINVFSIFIASLFLVPSIVLMVLFISARKVLR